jgi:hypothetical protein
MQISHIRQIIFDALKTAAPDAFDDPMRRSFLAGSDLKLADLNMDSLSSMEFCIALELTAGVSLLPSQLAELASTDAIERRIRETLE